MFFEENLTEWLGACICTVILGSDMGHSNQFLSYMLPEVMIHHINVFGSRPHLMHHGQFHSTRVVLKDLAVNIRLSTNDWNISLSHFFDEVHNGNCIS